MDGFDFEVAVVGAGPGGLVATLYLRRFLRSVLLVNAGAPRAHWIPRVNNLPGFRGGVSGPELLKRLWKQNEDLGTERIEGLFAVHPFPVQPLDGSASSGERHLTGFRLTGPSGSFSARRVVLATGVADVQPTIDNLIRLRRHGLLRYCPVCDAFEHRGKRLLVLAQDEHGIRSALFLAPFANGLEIIWPAGEPLPERLESHCLKAGIVFRRGWLRAIEELDGARGIRAILETEGRELAVPADAGYVELGIAVNDLAFRHLKALKRDETGRLITDGHQRLDIPGLYAVGDCVRGLAQISVAAAQAAIAATHIQNHLRDE